MGLPSEIINYSEYIVERYLHDVDLSDLDESQVVDLICIVLNSMPTNYVRNSIDYMVHHPERIYLAQEACEVATNKALKFLRNDPRRSERS